MLNPMLQNGLAFIAGMAASFIFVMFFEGLGHILYPVPNASDPEELKRAIKDLPLGAFLMVELAYLTGSFMGGYMAASLAASHKTAIALALGSLLTGFGIQNLITIPHPRWFAVLSTCTYLPMTFVGAQIYHMTYT